MAKKNKYYVVWNGPNPGIYTTWNECQLHINGVSNVRYKGFSSLQDAEQAFEESPELYWGKGEKKVKSLEDVLSGNSNIIQNSLSVDAACSGNPGKMEYRGVVTDSKKQLFIQGPFEKGTNNIGEFLALVHGLSFLKQKKSELPIYSDSKIAMKWVKMGQCKTNLQITSENRELFDLVKRAEMWLKRNHGLSGNILVLLLLLLLFMPVQKGGFQERQAGRVLTKSLLLLRVSCFIAWSLDYLTGSCLYRRYIAVRITI